MSDMNMMGGMPRPDDHEAAMARADLYKLANYSFKLFKMIRDGQELEGWVQAKVTKAADYIASVYHYMEYEMKFSEYGEKLEASDVYTESVKREFKRKLTEARVKLEKLRQQNISTLSEGWEDMQKDTEARKEKDKKAKGTGKFDVKKTSTGTQYTRKTSTYDDGGKGKDLKAAEKKQKQVKEVLAPQDIDGATAPPAKGASKIITSGPDKGKVWGSIDPKTGKKAVGPTNPTMKEAVKKIKEEPNEGNAFGKAVRDAKSSGTKQIKVGGETYPVKEELKGGQKKLDVNKNGKLEKSDFANLRAAKSDKVKEDRTEVKDAEGKVTSWKDEGDWKKSTAKKDPRGRVTNLSDKARRATEKPAASKSPAKK